MVQASTVSPEDAARLMRLVSGPLCPVPMVIYTFRPGLPALTVFSASTVRCCTVALL